MRRVARLRGRARSKTRRGAGVADVEGLKSGLEPMPAESFYEGLSGVGIELGPGLRVVESVWSGAGEAVLEVEVPGSSETGDAAGHGGGTAAAVLGGCFDALSVVLGESGAGEVWLGSGWERLWLAEGLAERVLCRVRLRVGGEESASDVRVGDVELHSVDGVVVGGVRGVELTRTTRAAVLSAVAGVEELLYAVAWRERALTGGLLPAEFLVSPGVVAEGAGEFAAHLAAEGVEGGVAVEGLLAELERLARGYALAGLEGLGWRREPGAVVHPSALRRSLKVVVGARAAAASAVRSAGGGWRSGADLGRCGGGGGGRDGLRHSRTPRHSGRSFWSVIRMVGWSWRCWGVAARHLPMCCGVVRSRVEVLFGGVASGASAPYHEAPLARALSRLAGAAVGALVEALPEGRRAAGAGGRCRRGDGGGAVGASRGAIRLPVRRGIGRAPFGAAAAECRRMLRVLDFERDPVGQGFEAHGYDVVVAANVLHATRDLGEALVALPCPCLHRRGRWWCLEGLRRQGWLDLTFGLLEGWWRYADGYRSEGALVGEGVWRRALEEAGYGEVSVLSSGADAAQGVIVARGPVRGGGGFGIVAGGDGPRGCGRTAGRGAGRSAGGVGPWWFRRGAGRGVGVAQSACGARGRGGDVAGGGGASEGTGGACGAAIAARRGARSSRSSPVRRRCAEWCICRGDGLDGAGEEATAEELFGEAEHGYASALALTQGLLDADVSPTDGMWLVTRGAQAVGWERDGVLWGAALWGLGRTVALEAPGLGARLVDLDPEGEPDRRRPGRGAALSGP